MERKEAMCAGDDGDSSFASATSQTPISSPDLDLETELEGTKRNSRKILPILVTESGRSTTPFRPPTPNQFSIHASQDRLRAKQVFAVCVHMGLNVSALVSVLVARPQLLALVQNTDSLAAAQTLATMTAGVGLSEFFLNPIVGRLSDAWGRKGFMLQSPVMSVVLKTLVFLKPSLGTIVLERCLGGACSTIAGSTNSVSALADIIDDPTELGKANAMLGAAAGAGVVVGPLLGAAAMSMLSRDRDPRYAYLMGAGVSLVQGLWVAQTIHEPLAPAKRKAVHSVDELLASVSPLSFLKLYSKTRVLGTLATVAALQCCCEGKAISDLNAYYLLNEAKLTPNLRSLYTTCFGATMTLSGFIGREMIKIFGLRTHTTLQNFMTASGFCMVGSFPTASAIFGALFIYLFAMERRAAVSSLAAKVVAAATFIPHTPGTHRVHCAFFSVLFLCVRASQHPSPPVEHPRNARVLPCVLSWHPCAPRREGCGTSIVNSPDA
eukprot:m.319579 g.319579  ORF g.319579 m.319579 type:complete len:494 (-) comp20305_c0_seq14:445-1926(-)